MKHLSVFRVAVGLVPGYSSSYEANLKSLVVNRVQPMKPLYGIQSEVQGWPHNLLSKPGRFWGGKGKLFTVMSESENWGCPWTQWVTLPNGTRNGTCSNITRKAIKTQVTGLYSQSFIFSSFGIKIVPVWQVHWWWYYSSSGDCSFRTTVLPRPAWHS